MGKDKSSSPVLLISACIMLTGLIIGAAIIAVHGFFIGRWLLPYWQAMTDAQASIVSQLLFFLAAAWASVIVPLLFKEQLRTLEDATRDARETSGEVAKRLSEMAATADQQFKEISRYQQLALGYVADEGLLSDLKDKKGFIDNAWTSVRPKVMEAISHLHGHSQNYIWKNKERTEPWWEAVKQSNALRDYFAKFKVISDAKWAVSRTNSAAPDLSLLRNVNDSLKEIQNFDPVGGTENAVTLQSLSDELLAVKELLRKLASTGAANLSRPSGYQPTLPS